jgi:hypothetical protein
MRCQGAGGLPYRSGPVAFRSRGIRDTSTVWAAEALPAVESESASQGLGHRGLLGHEPYRLDEGNCRSDAPVP